jgi:hypothetical protein
VIRRSSVAAIRIADPISARAANGDANRAAKPRIATKVIGLMSPPTPIHAPTAISTEKTACTATPLSIKPATDCHSALRPTRC